MTFPSSIKFRNFEAVGFHSSVFEENASKIVNAERVAKVLRECQALVVCSCMEFEDEYLSY